MKNLKISITIKSLVLAGLVIVLSGCSIEENNKKTLTANDEYKDEKYYNYLNENNFVPLKVNNNGEFTNVICGSFIYKIKTDTKLNIDGDLEFSDVLVPLSLEEQETFTGAVKISDEAYYNVYVVNKKDGNYYSEQTDIKDVSNYANCYIDQDEKLILKDPKDAVMYEGRLVKKLKK